MTISTRRGFLAGAATLPLVAHATSMAPPAAHPDAELLAACAAFDDLERQALATFAGRDFDDPAEIAADFERESIVEAQIPPVDIIASHHAITKEGMAARARSIRLWAPDEFRENGHFSGRTVHALLRDLTA
ncbi:hypothetical protein [Acidisphaera sp. L21]|uniref:hypothetical protein n=1 Tax=Acidisphaera sp. L21 TaxID=1641851 RepID=UPI00131CF3C6|nr:hypothetical protein [Acidisphaera sp. L21]